MRIDEANWLGLEPRRPGETLRAALARTLRNAILTGALRDGVRLPSSRALAIQLGISRGVASDAYAQLEAQGFLVVRPRSAPLVASVPRRSPEAQPVEAVRPRFRYDLTPTSPDVTLFPLRSWIAAIQQVGRREGPSVLGYREPRGERALREALADHLGRTRGVIADPEQITIVQGTAQGVDVLLRVLLARGATRVAVEDPSHTTHHERVRALGLELVPQPVDGEGMIVDELAAGAVLITPAHQFPTGSVLSGERRRRLIEWARDRGGLIAEDDYDSEFRYDREPVRALQGLAPDQVVQLGTVSKTLAPALRLGWVVAPATLADEVTRAKRLLDDFSPALDQLALAELLRRGEYDRHVRRARAVYRRRRDRLLEALSRHLPELEVKGISAGVHVLLHLPAGFDDAAIVRRAAVAGIRLAALSEFSLDRTGPGGLVVGYGVVHEDAIEPATKELARVVRDRL